MFEILIPDQKAVENLCCDICEKRFQDLDNVLLVYDLKGPIDAGATIKALAARKIEVIVLQLGKLDLASPAGKLMLNMLAAVA